jgi:hypothetical protein
MPDGSASIMSGLSMNMSDIDSNYDTMSISSRLNISGTTIGRQKKKFVDKEKKKLLIKKNNKLSLMSIGNTIIVMIYSLKR